MTKREEIVEWFCEQHGCDSRMQTDGCDRNPCTNYKELATFLDQLTQEAYEKRIAEMFTGTGKVIVTFPREGV